MNLRFLIDEDLPRSTAKALSLAGYEALDVRDVGLRGVPVVLSWWIRKK